MNESGKLESFKAPALVFAAAGLTMLISVAMIAVQRFHTPIHPGWFAVPAILAQIGALGGLVSLYPLARRIHPLIAQAGLAAALTALAVILAAAAWLALAGIDRVEARIQYVAAAFTVAVVLAFLANAAALIRSEGAVKRVALCLLVPPLVWSAMIAFAFVGGIEAALALDLYTNAAAGVALVCTAAMLRRVQLA